MRTLVMVGLLGVGLTASASACPQGSRCIAMASGMAKLASLPAPRAETVAVPAPARRLSVTVHLSATDDGNHVLRRSLLSFRPALIHAGDIEMPELWAIVANQVTDRLPRYEDGEQFSMVLSPVVVSMPTESTPGLGLSGDF